MLDVAPGVVYLDRASWGADESLPRLGEPVPVDEATEMIEHHTVQRDDDPTPNIWENVAEAVVKMRELQVIRPDLGKDVPYSWVRFLMKYPDGKRGILLMEGRGAFRRGAHTMYHNRTGRATGTVGNFQLPTDVLPYVPAINGGWGWLKREFGLQNLGTVTPQFRMAFGHRDFRKEDDPRTWTLCPGDSIMDVIHLIKPELEEAEMRSTFKLLRQWNPAMTWLLEYIYGVPIYKRHLAFQATVDHLSTKLGPPQTIPKEQLETIPTL